MHACRKDTLFVISKEGKVKTISCGTRAYKNKIAKLRFTREEGGSSLYLTCLNQKEFGDGDLIAISEDKIRNVGAQVPQLKVLN